ncbi:restriction endonuclease [Helicobacter pylori]|uniref:restriction endonuclease subunit S n=1 Tax=Helicobacter pylori TaxID=210 RepID=UPI0006AF1299|nr:restriction endonuclease subunit S [Helicobacter pylori]KOS31710.1 restriction endonuclease [Helicobacter pylori]
MIGPLSSQLNAIKWGEFKLGDLFEIRPTKAYNLTNSHLFDNNAKNPVVTNSSLNNGISGYSSLEPTEKGNQITYSDTTTSEGIFYQKRPFIGYSHVQGLYPLKYHEFWNEKTLLYIVVAFKKVACGRFNYGNKFNRKIASEMLIQLPLKPTANTQTLEDIDFDFMEKFIAELEQCRLAELEAYLKATGLENTTLSSDEENALNVFNNNNSGGGGNTPCGLTWQSFRLGDLFEVLPYKKRFDANKVNIYASKTKDTYPYVVRTSLNNGIRGYLKENTNFLNAGNTISFGQDTATMFYQEKPYFTGDKIKILRCKNPNFNKINALFFITSLTKAFRNFSWGSASFSVSIIENQNISLPTNQDGGIDFHFMRTLINALMKQTIQGVAQYCNAKIQATKEVISQETPVQKDSLF